MLPSRFHPILLPLFWAFTTTFGDDTPLLCDETATAIDDHNEGLVTKALYFDDPNPEAFDQPLWDRMGMEDVIGVALANGGIWTFRFQRSLFPELLRGDREIPTLQPTFFEQSTLFQDKFSIPLHEKYRKVYETGQNKNEKWKNLGKFKKAFILSKSTSGGDVATLGLITAIARVIKAITKVGDGDVQWKTVGHAHDQNQLMVKMTKDDSGGQFSVLQASTYLFKDVRFSKWNRPGKNDLVFGRVSSPWKTPRAFGKEEEEKEKNEPSGLTKTQQLSYGIFGEEKLASPVELLDKKYDRNDDKFSKAPHATSFQLLRSDPRSRHQVYRNDDNIKPIDVTIIIVTWQSAWILMLPEGLLQAASSEGLHLKKTLANVRDDDWFKSDVKEPVLDHWKKTKTGSGEDQHPVRIHILHRADSSSPERGQYLAKAILEEIAASGVGPLKGDIGSWHIPTSTFLASGRVASTSDKFLAPKAFFVVENHYDETHHEWVFSAFYGPENVFSIVV